MVFFIFKIMPNNKDYFARTTRDMLGSVKEIGAMPFILFQYYLTYENASEGIYPSLDKIANDLGLKKSAICNLRKRLIKAGWIQEEKGQIFILKSFTKNENHSQKMNDGFTKNENHSQIVNQDSQKMNESFTKNESPYKEEREKKEREKREEEKQPAAQSQVQKNRARIPPDFAPTSDMVTWAKEKTPNIPIDLETEKFKIYWDGQQGQKALKNNWPSTWKNWMLSAVGYALKNGTYQPQQKQFQSSTSSGLHVSAAQLDVMERNWIEQRRREKALNVT